MSLADLDQGTQNLLEGDFGEHWVHVTAAGCGILHGRPHTLDVIKGDLLLTSRGNDWWENSVLVQVKTTVDLRPHGPDEWAYYDLDIATYDVLRTSKRRILAVIGLSPNGDPIQVGQGGTTLLGHTTWASLEGMPASKNATKQVVHLPRSNRLDLDGYQRMLANYGVPRSSPVPEINQWGESA